MQPWVGPTAALSLVVIALSFVVIAAAVVLSARAAAQQVKALMRTIETLRGEMTPSLQALQKVAEQARATLDTLGAEAQAIARTSRGIRRKVVRSVKSAEARYDRLTALYDTVYEEVETTALDLTDKVRAIKAGGNMIQQVRRLIRRRRG